MQKFIIGHVNLKYRGIILGIMLCLTLLASENILLAQQAQKTVNWDSWQFLLGEWIGEGGGAPGQGEGSFNFSLDLQKQVLVRKNHSDYPATKERQAYSHDDLMV